MKTYVIPALLAFIFAIFLWQLQKDRIEMTYNINDSELFPMDSTSAKFFVIDLLNTGNKEIESIDLDIVFSNGSVHNFSHSPLKEAKLKLNGLEITGSLPLLNPGEGVKIKCTIIGEEARLESFTARATGVTATSEPALSFYDFIIPLTTIVLLVFIGFYYLNTRQLRLDKAMDDLDIDNLEDERKNLSVEVDNSLKKSDSDRQKWLKELDKESEERDKKHQEYMKKLKEESKVREKEHNTFMKEMAKNELEVKQGKPDRTQLIFNCLNQNSLTHIFFKILNLGDGMTYLNTGFTLFMEYIINDNDEKYLTAMQQLSSLDMAPTSQGMLFYLTGKMESLRNNHEKVNYWLNKCKDEYPLLYEFLMKNDENFDLNQLKNEIKNWP